MPLGAVEVEVGMNDITCQNDSKCYLCVPAWNALHVQVLTFNVIQVFVHYFCSETDNVEKQFTLFGHPLHRAVESWNSQHNLANLFSSEFTMSKWGLWRNHQSTSISHHDIFTLYTHAWFKFQTMVFLGCGTHSLKGHCHITEGGFRTVCMT